MITIIDVSDLKKNEHEMTFRYVSGLPYTQSDRGHDPSIGSCSLPNHGIYVTFQVPFEQS